MLALLSGSSSFRGEKGNKIRKKKRNDIKKGILHVSDQMEKPYSRVNHITILCQKKKKKQNSVISK